MSVFAGARIRANNVFGATTNNPLAIGGTTLNSAGLANLPAVSGDHAVIVLDPLRTAGAPEIVIVTAHTGAATSATITRGAYGTAARSHASGTLWVHAPTIDDVIRIVTSSTRPADQYEGQFIFETDTNKLVGFGGVDWAPRDAGGQLGYAQAVASQGSITTLVDLTSLSVAVTVGTGRRVKITAACLAGSTVAADTIDLLIREGSTTLQIAEFRATAASSSESLQAAVVLTPSAGAHTYKLSMQRAAGSGTVTMTAGATFPAFILVEDMGAA